MNRLKKVSRLHLLVIPVLLIALVAAACGSDDASLVASGDGDDDPSPQRIRMVETATIFTEADIKAIGWKGQKDFLLDYPGATTFKWGFMNQTEVGVLIYASAADAQTLGVEAANSQTFRREVDDQAPDEGMDRISCRDAAGQSAVKAETGFPSKSFSGSYLAPEDDSADVMGRSCSNRFPTYNDYTVVGNAVFMCEGDGGRLLEPSTNCAKVAEWLGAS
jgi:hypothetical protein